MYYTDLGGISNSNSDILMFKVVIILHYIVIHPMFAVE